MLVLYFLFKRIYPFFSNNKLFQYFHSIDILIFTLAKLVGIIYQEKKQYRTCVQGKQYSSRMCQHNANIIRRKGRHRVFTDLIVTTNSNIKPSVKKPFVPWNSEHKTNMVVFRIIFVLFYVFIF